MIGRAGKNNIPGNTFFLYLIKQHISRKKKNSSERQALHLQVRHRKKTNTSLI